MSHRATYYVSELTMHEDGTLLKAREKLVLYYLANCHNPETRAAYAGLRSISTNSLCSRRMAIYVIKSLEKHGTILVERLKIPNTKLAPGERTHKGRRNEVNLYYFTAFEKKDGAVGFQGRSNGKQTSDKLYCEALRSTFAPPSATVALGSETQIALPLVQPLHQGSATAIAPDSKSLTPPPAGACARALEDPAGSEVLDPKVAGRNPAQTRRELLSALNQKRKIEARDRRERIEAAIKMERDESAREAHAGTGPPSDPRIRIRPEMLEKIEERRKKEMVGWEGWAAEKTRGQRP